MRPIFFSYFVQMILQMNGIECKNEDLTESPKVIDYNVVAKMRQYKDLNGNYYYLEDSGIHIYDGKIVEHEKKAAETTGPFAASVGVAYSTSPDVKTLIKDMLHTLLVDNQVREDWIMACIDVIAHASEESKLRMKIKVKEEIQALERHLVTRIEALKI